MSTLDRIRATWFPKDKRALLESLSEQSSALEGPISWVLARPDHPRFGECADLAAQLGIRTSLDQLREAGTRSSGAVRAIALNTIDRIESVDARALHSGLADSDPAVSVAALNAIARHGGASPEFQTVTIEQFESKFEAVRQAAVDALPKRLTADAQHELLRLVSNPVARPYVIRTLGRLDLSLEDFDRLLDSIIGSIEVDDSETIAAFGSVACHERVQTLMWRIALDYGAEDAWRVAALRCLEAAKAETRSRLADIINWPPRIRYFAARLMCRNGDHRALGLLLALAEAEGAGDPDLQRESRKLLARMLDLPPHAPMAQLRSRVTIGVEGVPESLPAAPRF